MDEKMIEELMEHVDAIISLIEDNVDEKFYVIEEFAHQLKEEIEGFYENV